MPKLLRVSIIATVCIQMMVNDEGVRSPFLNRTSSSLVPYALARTRDVTLARGTWLTTNDEDGT